MTAERANGEEALASAERLAIVGLLERGFLHVNSFVGNPPEARLALARGLQERLRSEDREAVVLHRAAATRVYAKRPKKKEPA
jgi:hypothetical protein